jgi:hypothetical protein
VSDFNSVSGEKHLPGTPPRPAHTDPATSTVTLTTDGLSSRADESSGTSGELFSEFKHKLQLALLKPNEFKPSITIIKPLLSIKFDAIKQKICSPRIVKSQSNNDHKHTFW